MLKGFIDTPITDELIKSNFPDKDLNKNYSRLQVSYNDKTPRLCDYYITGSYLSYSCTKDSPTSSLYLKKLIQSGIRAIHLDLCDKDSDVIVCNENNNEGEKFEDICKTINNYIDQEEILADYPFIIFLNLKYDKFYYDLSDKIANILKKNFNDKLPDIRYNFNRYKIGREYITNFKGKVIILLDRYDNGDALNELTHGVIHEENNDNNDKHITKVKFDVSNISLKNRGLNRFFDMNSIFGNKNKVLKKTKDDLIFVYTEDDIYFNMDSTDKDSSKDYGINVCMNKFKIKEGLETVTSDYMNQFRDINGNHQPFMLKPEEQMNQNKPLIIEKVNKNKTLQTKLDLTKEIDFGGL